MADILKELQHLFVLHETKKLFDLIEAAMHETLAAWSLVPPPEMPGHAPSRVLMGRNMAAGIVLTVAEFDIAPQGHPKGARGYDGMVAIGATIVRLPRERSKKLFDYGIEKLGGA